MGLWFILICPFLALGTAFGLSIYILRQKEGSQEMKKIARAVRIGALAYLKRQYRIVAIFFAIVFCLLSFLVGEGYLNIFIPFAFLTGGFWSGLSGFIGMTIATKSSARTAAACQKSLNKGLKVAFASGTVMGLCVVGLTLVDLNVWFRVLNWYFRELPLTLRIQNITNIMLCQAMGASFIALFARVGGGIFTKAADVGADLVGKVEAGIPEDDPRNPAVIADNVGDNVGDVAGMGADLYESYLGSIVATMALAVAGFSALPGIISSQLLFRATLIPLFIAGIGIISSIVGTFFVKTSEDATQTNLLAALRKGVFISTGLVAIAAFFLIRQFLGPTFLKVYSGVMAGLIAGIIIGLSTEYFTSHKYSPTRHVSASAETGPATLIIGGLSTGMLSTAVPVVTIGITILISFYLSGGGSSFNLGLYGVGLAAVSMLSTLGITLATDAYGPVADNAGGNAEMSHQPPEVRKRTDALDALGNTTAATGKGFAIGAAGLTALVLIAAYKNQVGLLGEKLSLSLLNPKVIFGLFIGAMLPFVFCSLTMKAVGKAAQKIVIEVRRQFREIAGLMEGKALPDYAKCVDISTRSAQKEMIVPSIMAVVVPLLIGWLFGAETVVGLLAGTTICGFVLAIMMANTGGLWDNAKKYIEEGQHGGKGSPAHKAAVVGDTIGDPFKDTSGPSLNILLKLMSTVSLVFASFVIKNVLFK